MKSEDAQFVKLLSYIPEESLFQMFDLLRVRYKADKTNKRVKSDIVMVLGLIIVKLRDENLEKIIDRYEHFESFEELTKLFNKDGNNQD